MILDASRRRAQGPWTRARLVVPGMRSASTWRLAGQGTPAGRLAVRRAARWRPAATGVCGSAVGAVVAYFLDSKRRPSPPSHRAGPCARDRPAVTPVRVEMPRLRR